MKTKKTATLLLSVLLLSLFVFSCQPKTLQPEKKDNLKNKSVSEAPKKELASDLEFLVANSDTQLFRKNYQSVLTVYSLLTKSENGISGFAFSENNRSLNFFTASENVYSFNLAENKLKKVEVANGGKIIPLGFSEDGDKLIFVQIPPEKETLERFKGTYCVHSFKKSQSEPLFKEKLMFLGASLPDELFLNDIEEGGSEKSDVYVVHLKTKKSRLFIKNAQLIEKSPDNQKFLLSRLSGEWYEKNGDASHLELWIVNYDGSNLEKIAFVGMQPGACFSPDGSKIAFLQVYNPKKPAQLVIFDLQTKNQKIARSLKKYNLEKLQWIDSDRLLFTTNPYAGKSFVGLYSLGKNTWVKIFDDASVNNVLKVFVKR